MRQWLFEKRMQHNMKQSDISDLCGCTRNLYNMIEKGKRRPSPELAQKIALILEFDWTIFFTSKCNEMTHNGSIAEGI